MKEGERKKVGGEGEGINYSVFGAGVAQRSNEERTQAFLLFVFGVWSTAVIQFDRAVAPRCDEEEKKDREPKQHLEEGMC